MITLRIEKSAFGGFGLTFHDTHAMFIPFVLPGELVEITEPEYKRSVGFSKPVKILEPSEDRITPECPNFGTCGGCDYLHMTYERELVEKKAILKDALLRIGKFKEDAIPEIETIHGERFHYRSHASVKTDSAGLCGFFAKDSHDVIPFPEQGCLLLDNRLNQVLKGTYNAQEVKAAVDKDGHVLLSVGDTVLMSDLELGVEYTREIHTFFQANRFLRAQMITEVLKGASAAQDSTVLDLGCGTGFFTLQAAKKCRSAHGIDISEESIASAKKNAAENGITNVSFNAKPDDRTDPVRDAADIVITDPPRAGLSAKTKNSLIRMKPSRIVYVSCNVTTWARDVKDFSMEGFHLSHCTMIDMFPGTLHIEVISVLER